MRVISEPARLGDIRPGELFRVVHSGGERAPRPALDGPWMHAWLRIEGEAHESFADVLVMRLTVEG